MTSPSDDVDQAADEQPARPARPKRPAVPNAGEALPQDVTARMCTERAARALGKAEGSASGGYVESTTLHLAVAQGWRDLGIAMSNHPGMTDMRLPADDD